MKTAHRSLPRAATSRVVHGKPLAYCAAIILPWQGIRRDTATAEWQVSPRLTGCRGKKRCHGIATVPRAGIDRVISMPVNRPPCLSIEDRSRSPSDPCKSVALQPLGLNTPPPVIQCGPWYRLPLARVTRWLDWRFSTAGQRNTHQSTSILGPGGIDPQTGREGGFDPGRPPWICPKGRTPALDHLLRVFARFLGVVRALFWDGGPAHG